MSFFFQEQPPYQVGNVCAREFGVVEEGVCCKIVLFKDMKFKHELFVKIDMKHSYLVCNEFFLLLKL